MLAESEFPGTRRWLARSRAAALLLASLVALLFAGAAPLSAHANLVRSNPAAGAVLGTAPAQVQLWFSEQPDPHFSDLQVQDANRQRVDSADRHVAPGDPLSLIVTVKPGLPVGLYTVSWKTVSAVDGHVVNGNFPFYIGQPPQGTVLPSASQAGPASSGSQPTFGTALVRWLSLLSAVTLLGGFAFWSLVLGPAFRATLALLPGPGAMAASVSLEGSYPAPRAARQRSATILEVAWIILVAATLATLLQQAQSASGGGFVHALGAPLRTLLLDTRFGRAWWLRAAATIIAGAPLACLGVPPCGRAQDPPRRGSGNWTWTPSALGIAAIEVVLLSFSLNSHAAALNSGSLLATASDFLHVSAVGLWVGGLVQLALVLPPALRELVAAQRIRLLANAVPRFSALASACVGVILITGVYQALRQLPTVEALWLTGWGRTLQLKLGLVVPLLLLGAVNLLIVRPALARAAAGSANGQGTMLPRRFLAAVAAETLLGVTILAVVAVLVNQPPPQMAAATSGIHLTSKAEGVTVKLTITPGQLGPNHFEATVDVRGKPPPEGTQLVLRLTYADADMGTTELTTQAEGKGRFSADSSDLSTYGRWQILALLQPPAADEVRTDFTMALSAGSASGSGSQSSGGTSVKKGRELYLANCAQCHGADARGDGPQAKQLDPPPANLIEHVPQHNDQRLLDWITNGIPASAMPAFGSKLSATDRQAILNYLRDLTKNATPAAPTPTPSAGP